MTTRTIGATEVKEQYLDVPGVRLYVAEAGRGPVVVLLHGGGPGASGLSNFSKNIASLAAHFRVIIPDLPGYGKSGKPEIQGDYWIFAARAVRDMLDALGVEQADLIGNSLGGGATVRFALDYPERARKLLLMGPAGVSHSVLTPRPSEGVKILSQFYAPPGPSVQRMAEFVHMMVYNPALATPVLIEDRLRAATAPDAEAGMLRTLRAIFGSPEAELWRWLENVPHKTLLVWGRDDRVVPVDGALFALARFPNADLHVFSQCGHWAQTEKLDEFNALAREFFSA